MAFSIIKNDITKVDTDAIVLPANPMLREGPGSSHAIFEAAGRKELTEACRKIGRCDIGSAVITDGFSLPAKYIIHTVNPPYIDGAHNEGKLLKKAYLSALELAAENNLKSIAFPLLSSGNYGYPRGEALELANDAIRGFLNSDELYSDMDIILVLKDESAIRDEIIFSDEIDYYLSRRNENFYNILEGRLCNSTAKKKEHKAEPKTEHKTEHKAEPQAKVLCDIDECHTVFDTVAEHHKMELKCNDKLFDGSAELPPFGPLVSPVTFIDLLIKHINDSGMTNPQIYTKANINRKTFSKIMSGDVLPKKGTILALAIALKLNLKETNELLAKAGHAMIDADLGDMIVRWFILHKKYDIFLINETLFANNQKLLGNTIA